LTKRKPALVIRAVQLVLQESIGVIGVRRGAARTASPASGPKERPVARIISRDEAASIRFAVN